MDQALLQEQMNDAEQRARQYFREGLNCAECVLRSFIDVKGTDLPDSIIRLASGFGGGMGKTRNTCGAVTGAMLAVGTERGRDPFRLEEPKERIKELQEVYKPFAAMIQEIKGNYGTIICKELNSKYEDFGGRERKKSCQQIIGYCAARAIEYAAWQEENAEADK